MERIELTVKMANIYEYTRAAFGYGTEIAYIYNMKDEEGNVYVWKTTSFMVIEYEDEKGYITKRNGKTYNTSRIYKGDVIRIKASVKGHSKYKGQPQTELSRVKVIERISSWEVAKQEKIYAQYRSLQGEDFVWRMPYKQFKEHYSDCETIIDSYRIEEEGKLFGVGTIEVIIREGRMKNSGVRGRHYNGYAFEYTEDGKKYNVCYRAITEDNALKRLKKENPEATDIECVQVFMYY